MSLRSTLEIGPILRAMLRNKTGAILIALQCAITLAILLNAIHIITTRMDKMNRPSGLDTNNIISIQSIGFANGFNVQNSIAEDLATLRKLPGVVDATPINAIPQSGGGSSSTFRTSPEDGKNESNAAYYEVDEHAINALGLKLIAGRNFRPEEVKQLPERTDDYSRVAIVSKDYADVLYPDGDALGKPLYSGQDHQRTIIGIVERMQAAWVGWDKGYNTVIEPLITLENRVRYMIRTEPGRRDELMPVIEQTLQKLNSGRIVRGIKTQEEIARRAYSSDRAMTIILFTVVLLIVAITALGIVGLATFSVRRRTKQIGTRRALGARQVDILRHFMLENWLITTAGVVVGIALALVLNLWLVKTFSLPRLEWSYIPLGVLFMWLVGQLAVFTPARRASLIPPAIATRSV